MGRPPGPARLPWKARVPKMESQDGSLEDAFFVFVLWFPRGLRSQTGKPAKIRILIGKQSNLKHYPSPAVLKLTNIALTSA
mgnify:CR=1 FL=1